MRNFTSIVENSVVNESSNGVDFLDDKKLNQYILKVGSTLPRNIQNALYLTKKYNILTKSEIEDIKDMTKSSLGKLQGRYKMTEGDADAIYTVVHDAGTNIKMLPQMQNETEFKAMLAGRCQISDVLIDLTTSKGRNEAAKMYMPIVYKIANQYVGKSRLNKADLISAGEEGFAEALVDFDDSKGVLFKTYVSYRVQQAILNEINSKGHTLSGTSWYSAEKFGGAMLDAISLDGVSKNDDGEFQNDRLAALGEDPEPLDRDEEKKWNELYDLLEKNFKTRDTDIFYRFFGLHGHQREKSKDIAKAYGMSEGNIRNSVINKMLSFIKNNKKASEIISDIQELYTESLMCNMLGMSKEMILETLAQDDTYILLEELNRWNNKDEFMHYLFLAYEGMKNNENTIITNILSGDFNTIDDEYKKNKKIIIKFLKLMYPTENFSRKSDVAVIEYMADIQNAYQKHNVKK